MCVDLHTHSLYSDGSHSPRELVDMALKNRLSCLALTDHDTVEGVPELLRLGREAGLAVIGGVEISTCFRGLTVHVLGYGVDPDLPGLHDWLRPLQNGRADRNRRILENLAVLGIPISPEELAAEAGEGQCGRPHIAKILVRRGVVATTDEAFDRYLARDKPAWAPRFSYESPEAIAMIHSAGGRAVLAHPGVLGLDQDGLADVFQELTRAGLDGVEVWYPSHGKPFRALLLDLARRLGLLVTGGSDFHGATRPAHPMAKTGCSFCPPDDILPPLLAVLDKSPRS